MSKRIGEFERRSAVRRGDGKIRVRLTEPQRKRHVNPPKNVAIFL